ncbi:MAG TPA: hypothetical protein VGL66_13245 [Caulobacteraceae bacterium]
MAAVPPLAAAKGATDTYVNARYGYSVSYPRGLFKPQPESDSGDGRVFTATRDGAEFRVWANYAGQDMTPTQLADEILADCTGHKASYRVVKPNLVAISCQSSQGVLYEKELIHNGLVTAFMITYPSAQSAYWNPVTAAISNSLRAGH